MCGQWLESGRKEHLNLCISLLRHTHTQPPCPNPRSLWTHSVGGGVFGRIRGKAPGTWAHIVPHPWTGCRDWRAAATLASERARALTCPAFPGATSARCAQGSGELVPRREWQLHPTPRRSAAPGHVRVSRHQLAHHPPAHTHTPRKNYPSKSLLGPARTSLSLSPVLSNLRAQNWSPFPAVGVCSLVTLEGLHPPPIPRFWPYPFLMLFWVIFSFSEAIRPMLPIRVPCCTKLG